MVLDKKYFTKKQWKRYKKLAKKHEDREDVMIKGAWDLVNAHIITGALDLTSEQYNNFQLAYAKRNYMYIMKED